MIIKMVVVLVNLVCLLGCTSTKKFESKQAFEDLDTDQIEKKQTLAKASCEPIQMPKEVYAVDDLQFVAGSVNDLIVTAKLRNSMAKVFSLSIQDNLKTNVNENIAPIQESALRAIYSKRSGNQTLMLLYKKQKGRPILQWQSTGDAGPSDIVSIDLTSEVVEHEVQSFDSRVYVTLRHSVYETSFLVLDLLDTKNPLKRLNYVSQSRNSKLVGSARGQNGYILEKIINKDIDALNLTTISLTSLEVVKSQKIYSKNDALTIESVDFSTNDDSAIIVASVGDSMIGEASISAVELDLLNLPNEINWSNKIEFKDAHLSEVRIFQSKQSIRAFVFDWISEKPKLSRLKFDQQGLVKERSWQGFFSGSALIDATRLTDDWLLVIRAKRSENYIYQICRIE